MRRLTAEQYRSAIADTFDHSIEIAGRFEPDNRRGGLIAMVLAMNAISIAFRVYLRGKKKW